MKKNFNELIILCVQLFMFYIFPLFMYLLHPITMVILIILVTFILSLILGFVSNNKIKYLYPEIIAILFLPTVYIYYNESALVHSLWYLITSIIGIFIGIITKRIVKKISCHKRSYIIFIILAFMVVGTIIYFNNNRQFNIGNQPNINIIENEGVSLSIKKNTVTQTGLTLILKNDNNEDIIYSEQYEIEAKKDNVWHSINVEIDFTMTKSVLKSKNSHELTINWEKEYGKLAHGNYRIIKEMTISKKDGTIDKFYVSSEFNI